MTFGCAALTVLTLGASEGFPLTMEADIWASLTNRFFDARTAVVEEASTGYNAWPMVQTLGSKVVCAYSRGTAHHIGEGVRGVFARVSSDGGATWGDEVQVANDAAFGEVTIGKGLDADGAMLLWVRCWGKRNSHHDLYRTSSDRVLVGVSL